MKLPTRTSTAIAAAFALTVLPAGLATAQEADCEVVEGPGSAAGDVECEQETSNGGVGGETVDNEVDNGNQPDSVDEDDETSVLPGRIDRPTDGAPAGDEDATTDAAPNVESADAELAATGTDADVALVAGLAALTLGGGALAATRRRQRTES